MTDDELIQICEHAGLIAGQHWKLAKVDGKPEVVVSVDGIKLLARYSPDQEKAQRFLADFQEHMRRQGYTP